MKQLSFADIEYSAKKRLTRREKFLNEMEEVVPWDKMVAVIRPHYPTHGRRGSQPMPLESMLRIYLMQHWYSQSDPAMEDALYEITSMRNFAKLSVSERIPDETTILKFRHLLEKHNLTDRLLEVINEVLSAHNLLMSAGTMVDATLIHAPASTKNKQQQRTPEMRHTRKGNQSYFGMKLHIGADIKSAVVHTVAVTPANVADIDILDDLVRKKDKVIVGDAGYSSDTRKRQARKNNVTWMVNDKRKPKHTKYKRINLSNTQKKRNKKYSSIRARVEHIFRIIKCQFGYTKTRYKGLMKNASSVKTLVALANLYLVRRQLAA